jgi:hypothetical protein
VATLGALGGALIGGLITFLSVRSSDRRNAEREDRLRWIRDLRDVGANLVSHCHDLEDSAFQLFKSHEPGRTPLDTYQREELYRRMLEAKQVIDRSTTLIAMLAPEEIVDKANEIPQLASDLGRYSEDADFDYSEIRTEFSETITDLIMLMREHLGADEPSSGDNKK